MIKFETEVPVYLNFFNRPNTFRKVFNAVKEAKPSILFLSCDGPRKGRNDDVENIEKCKEIVNDINWECKVYKNYSDDNLGCGKRMYSGISWAFEYVDRLIVLEDDCVPSNDFFLFCQELLEKYKDDNRIYMINAMNHLIEYNDTNSSYFFGPGCCWGWATWKRAWEQVDFDMNFLNDSYSMKCIERKYPFYNNSIKEGKIKKQKLLMENKMSSWTYQSGMACALSSQMAIIPKVNLITNIGLTEDSVHAVNNSKKISIRTQKYFNLPTKKIEFPLKHPRYIVEDWNYYDLVNKEYRKTIFSTLEGYIRQIIYAEKGERTLFLKKVLRKIKGHIF